jgi:hypothetical protein
LRPPPINPPPVALPLELLPELLGTDTAGAGALLLELLFELEFELYLEELSELLL